MVDPGYTKEVDEETEEETLIRSIAMPYVPGPLDHTWVSRVCVKCSTPFTGPRAVLPCRNVGHLNA